MESLTELSPGYTLTAGESDAEGRMPLTLVTERVIEVATEHANALGIGYATLIKKNVGWVLSRLSIEMLRYPAINDSYTLTTWVESYNRRFSERNFAMTDPAGNIYGHMRTVWVPMDFAKRTVADINEFIEGGMPLSDTPCPIAKTPRIPPLPQECTSECYTFRYRDIDFNRHVNTVRYLDLILNHWSLEHFDKHIPSRFDILFHHECHYGEEICLHVAPGTEACPGDICELTKADGTRAVAARIFWKKV